jgi:hypothetical protein
VAPNSYPEIVGNGTLELGLASVVVVVGAVLTTLGAFAHGGPLIAPGAALVLVGAAWFGNVLARRDVRLFASGASAADKQDEAA